MDHKKATLTSPEEAASFPLLLERMGTSSADTLDAVGSLPGACDMVGVPALSPPELAATLPRVMSFRLPAAAA